MWLFEIDVALVTSLRDGMNLVSYEYVACQNLRMTEGVLVLSEVRCCHCTAEKFQYLHERECHFDDGSFVVSCL